MHQAIQLTQTEDRKTQAALVSLDDAQLPALDVTVAVQYSTLNYKDALAITGRGAVVRKWPLVPGIDLAGVVETSRDARFAPGDAVVLTGAGIGEEYDGGLAQKQCVRAEGLIKLPAPFTARSAMAVGTAGFTAALCVAALQQHGLQPGAGEVLVTGAAGGVGSVAVALLAALGHSVVASTGRAEEADYLKGLGAARIIDRATLSAAGKPLQKETWAAVVDTVGSHTLANACAATRANGAVAACGLAQGPDLPATVLPFILRGVTLYGINSVYVSDERRLRAWALLAQHLDLAKLEGMTQEIGLTQVIDFAPRFLAGQVRGRTVVNLAR
jgi:acrylyl-CoA reductase (NADPH)